MTKKLIDIQDESIKKLSLIAKETHVSSSELIRKAVEEFLLKYEKSKEIDVFGILAKRKFTDPVKYQRKMRGEW